MWKDDVIEQQADRIAACEALIAALQSDIVIYHEILREAVARCSELRRENEMIASRACVYRTRTAPRDQEVAA